MAETPIFIVFSAKMQNLKKHKKEKKTLFVSTPVLTALVKMSFFCAFFIFGFFAISNFSEMFFDRWPKFKKLQNMKATKTKNNKKKKTRYKAKINQT